MAAFFINSIFTVLVAGAALKNITITVPDGTTGHGDPDLLCRPANWKDVIVFYLGNYVAHAATVITVPGELTESVIVTILFAILFPTSGVMRGARAIASFARSATNDLQKAACAGALCMVVRTEHWRPLKDDKVPQAVLRVGKVDGQADRGNFSSFHNHACDF